MSIPADHAAVTATAPAAPDRGSTLAPLLAWILGATDAIGFVTGGTYFVGFMAGDTTRLAAAAALSDREIARTAAALSVLFVIGVTIATLARARRRARSMAPLLVAQAALLGLAAWLPGIGRGGAGLAAAILAMAFAHAAIDVDGRGSSTGLGITRVLVGLERGLADAIAGGPRGGWTGPLLVWAIVAVGGLAGAMLAIRVGAAAFWMPATASLIAALSQSRGPGYGARARGPGGRRRR